MFYFHLGFCSSAGGLAPPEPPCSSKQGNGGLFFKIPQLSLPVPGEAHPEGRQPSWVGVESSTCQSSPWGSLSHSLAPPTNHSHAHHIRVGLPGGLRGGCMCVCWGAEEEGACGPGRQEAWEDVRCRQQGACRPGALICIPQRPTHMVGGAQGIWRDELSREAPWPPHPT